MVDSNAPNPRSITLLDTREFLADNASGDRMDRALNGDVTVSAIPDGSGGTRWEARTADGQPLKLFQLTIEPAMAAGPMVIDTTTGVYVCYEDTAAQRNWCVQVKSHF